MVCGVPAEVSIQPAATVVVLRDTPHGPEVFLVRRHHAFAFMAGAHVFPGGRVDSADADLAARDAQLVAHAEFRKELYSYDVVPAARAAATLLQ